VIVDSGNQFRHAFASFPAYALVRNPSESTLHKVEPRRRSGNEVEMKAEAQFGHAAAHLAESLASA
jgi:hypothetical protein